MWLGCTAANTLLARWHKYRPENSLELGLGTITDKAKIWEAIAAGQRRKRVRPANRYFNGLRAVASPAVRGDGLRQRGLKYFPCNSLQALKTFPAQRKIFPAIRRREMLRQPFVSRAKYPANLAQAALIFAISLFSSLLARQFCPETGLRPTASSASY